MRSLNLVRGISAVTGGDEDVWLRMRLSPRRQRQPVRLRSARGMLGHDLTLLFADSAALTLSLLVMLAARYDGRVPAGAWSLFWWFLPWPVLLALLLNRSWGLYGRIWRHASIYEARRVLGSGLCASVALVGSTVVAHHAIPVSVAGTAGISYTMLIGGLRFRTRLFRARPQARASTGLRIAVVGAGELGAMTVRSMLAEPDRSGLHPVVVLDDDPHTHGRALFGVPVLGPIGLLPRVVRMQRINLVVLAIRTPTAALVRRVADDAASADIPLRMAPEVSAILRHGVQLRDLRDISIEDLLGRREVVTNLDAVRSLLGGRRVLVTGAGGSIGAEIARQVAACGPSALYLLDHDETHLYDAASTVQSPVDQVLADIRDVDVLCATFARLRPQVVFHAAAHKHVPLLEAHACEAVRTNVLGTAALVRACEATGVERFVLISTDKAVHPSSVMGASKRLAEHVVLCERSSGTIYCGVRFGNVLGSRGSVVPTFLREVSAGGPLTVTDARMSRFFMSIREAVQLVLQAATLARGGELFMLEMGEPVRIIDLAHRMIRLAGQRPGTDVEIRVTGVRPGEKLNEELHTSDEAVRPTEHPSVMQLTPACLPAGLLAASLSQLADLAARSDEERTRSALMRLASLPAPAGPYARPSTLIDRRECREWSPSSI